MGQVRSGQVRSGQLQQLRRSGYMGGMSWCNQGRGYRGGEGPGQLK